MSDHLKEFYSTYHDKITDKRFNSPHPVRRSVHRDIYNSILKFIQPEWRVLDAGCGEGVLSLLMTEKGASVVGADISKPNIEAAQQKKHDRNLGDDRLIFKLGDAADLPFADNSFDCVVSNHVIEHLPDFDQGIREVYRVTRKHAVIAVPTCLNPCAWALLGGDTYWRVSLRTPFAIPIGALRVLWALLSKAEGVNQGYAGRKEIIHIFRFPWKAKKGIRAAGFKIIDYEAQSLRLPYVPLAIDTTRMHRVFRGYGIGTVFLLEKT